MIKEKRNARRQRLHYTAWVALTAEQRQVCLLSDVSESGARIDVQDSKVLPDCFVLMLTSNGTPRRYCRVMWRSPAQVGVKFERSLAEAEEAGRAAKSAAEAKAASAPADSAPVSAEPAKTT